MQSFAGSRSFLGIRGRLLRSRGITFLVSLGSRSLSPIPRLQSQPADCSGRQREVVLSSPWRLGPPPPPSLRRAGAALSVRPRCARVLAPAGSVSSADVRDRACQTTRDSGKVVVVGGGGLVSSTPPGGAGDRVSRQCVTRADVRSREPPLRPAANPRHRPETMTRMTRMTRMTERPGLRSAVPSAPALRVFSPPPGDVTAAARPPRRFSRRDSVTGCSGSPSSSVCAADQGRRHGGPALRTGGGLSRRTTRMRRTRRGVGCAGMRALT